MYEARYRSVCIIYYRSLIFICIQFSSIAQSCLTVCNPMDCSTPGLPVHHQLPEFTQTHVHRVGDVIQPSHPVFPFSSCPQSFPASGSFSMNRLFTSCGQSIGASASASVQFSCSVMSSSLRPRKMQHARPTCPSPTPGVHPNLCPSSR